MVPAVGGCMKALSVRGASVRLAHHLPVVIVAGARVASRTAGRGATAGRWAAAAARGGCGRPAWAGGLVSSEPLAAIAAVASAVGISRR
jgi:hypothetical protein